MSASGGVYHREAQNANPGKSSCRLAMRGGSFYNTEEQRRRHAIRPGLTGYAQVHGRNALNWDEKFLMDVRYVDRITFCGDVEIVFGTVVKVFKREGISSATSVTMEDFEDYCKTLGRVSRD